MLQTEYSRSKIGFDTAENEFSTIGEHGKIIISFRKRKNTFSQPKYIFSVKMHEKVAKLMVELSKSQDDEIGDGTTGVVVSSALSADSQLPSLRQPAAVAPTASCRRWLSELRAAVVVVSSGLSADSQLGSEDCFS